MLHLNKIKTSCSTCKEVSPFNIRRAFDIFGDHSSAAWVTVPKDTQNFIFVFDCQSCSAAPDIFLVRRQGRRMTLCGRSPIEMALVPAFIPGLVEKYYRGALVAVQSGQTLAALFLLRVLIEQFTRGATTVPNSAKADQVLESYMDSLEPDFKSRFPSLKDIYGRLSEAIHSASESSDLFAQSLSEINAHFDARRVFRLSGRT